LKILLIRRRQFLNILCLYPLVYSNRLNENSQKASPCAAIVMETTVKAGLLATARTLMMLFLASFILRFCLSLKPFGGMMWTGGFFSNYFISIGQCQLYFGSTSQCQRTKKLIFYGSKLGTVFLFRASAPMYDICEILRTVWS
jgi:hypothetical protein